MPKHSWFSFNLCKCMQDLWVGVGNLGKIISKLTFFVFKRPSHLTLCMKSQLATNKEYILNRYHNRSSEHKVPFIKTWQLFLFLLCDSQVHANGCQKLSFVFKRRSLPTWNNNSPQTNNVFLSYTCRYRCLCWWNRKQETGYFWRNLGHTTITWSSQSTNRSWLWQLGSICHKLQLQTPTVSLTQNLWRTF